MLLKQAAQSQRQPPPEPTPADSAAPTKSGKQNKSLSKEKTSAAQEEAAATPAAVPKAAATTDAAASTGPAEEAVLPKRKHAERIFVDDAQKARFDAERLSLIGDDDVALTYRTVARDDARELVVRFIIRSSQTRRTNSVDFEKRCAALFFDDVPDTKVASMKEQVAQGMRYKKQVRLGRI